jgi:hypothetical protein
MGRNATSGGTGEQDIVWTMCNYIRNETQLEVSVVTKSDKISWATNCTSSEMKFERFTQSSASRNNTIH